MFRRLGWLVGLNYRSWSGKRLTDANAHPAKVKPVAMFDTVQEIAIYIHRFHNLDLFQQGCVHTDYILNLLPIPTVFGYIYKILSSNLFV